MRGKGEAYGAITVINAIATGKGAAIGIKLRTEAHIEIVDEDVIEGEIRIDGTEEVCDFDLVRAVKEVVFRKFGIEGGLRVFIRSEIPISRGLKSSSAAANALVSAVLDAIGEKLDPLEVIKLGVEAAKVAGVTITGAFDDACASLLGGLCITDNINTELIKREEVDRLPVVILVPRKRVSKGSLKGVNFKIVAPYVEEAFKLALAGKWRKAMVINGILYAALLGYDTSPIFEALKAGAIAAAVSGTGPAVVAVTEDPEGVREVWEEREDAERIIITETR
ncbi:MAG: shikimate kinase [Candidatus Baldrarchaeia archaeon]